MLRGDAGVEAIEVRLLESLNMRLEPIGLKVRQMCRKRGCIQCHNQPPGGRFS